MAQKYQVYYFCNMRVQYFRVDSIAIKEKKEKLKKYKNTSLFIDVCGAEVPFSKRSRSSDLIEFLHTLEGFKVVCIGVESIAMLGKNLPDILATTAIFNTLGITLKVDTLKIESLIHGKPNPVFMLLLKAFADVADMEKKTMVSLQQKGIAKAKKKGVYKGRIKGSVEPKEVLLKKYQRVIRSLSQGKTLRQTAKHCKVSLGTVQKVKKLV